MVKVSKVSVFGTPGGNVIQQSTVTFPISYPLRRGHENATPKRQPISQKFYGQNPITSACTIGVTAADGHCLKTVFFVLECAPFVGNEIKSHVPQNRKNNL